MAEIFIEQLKPGQEVNSVFVLKVEKLLPLRSGTGHYLEYMSDSWGVINGFTSFHRIERYLY